MGIQQPERRSRAEKIRGDAELAFLRPPTVQLSHGESAWLLEKDLILLTKF